jgi:hypothetical protein
LVLRAVAVYWYTNRDAFLRPLSTVLDACRILNLPKPTDKEKELLQSQSISVEDYFAECTTKIVYNFSTPDFDPNRERDTVFLMVPVDKYERATSPQEKIKIGSISQLESQGK